jgi:4-diphosphocytidyl-2-C-methyl-D-erythritol kinase
MTVTLAAPAKVNLWLRIGERRPSGYHDVDTLFCALDLADTVTVAAGPDGAGIRLHVDYAPPLTEMPDLGPASANLAVRAARAFAEQTGTAPDLDITLLKRIPPGGGLGGGSSNAAAVLRALTLLHPGALAPPALHQLAATLGSDVPFFLGDHPVAHGSGRGTDLTPLAALPARTVLVVLPRFGIATADAYRWLAEERAEGRRGEGRAVLYADEYADEHPGPMVKEAGLPVYTWQTVEAAASNDFESVVFRHHPELRALRDALLRTGARPALLAGSGSTLFGIYEDEAPATAAAALLRQSHPGVRAVVTRTRSR